MITTINKKEYLDLIPDFHGELLALNRFTELCEKLIARFYNFADTSDFQNEFLLGSIRAKIKGEAAIIINTSPIATWEELKAAFIAMPIKEMVTH